MRYLTNFGDSFVSGHTRDQLATIFERAAADTKALVVVRRHSMPDFPQSEDLWCLACPDDVRDLSDFWDRVRELKNAIKPEGRPHR